MKLMQRFGDQIDDRYVESYLKWIRDYPGCVDDIWFATYYGYPTLEKHRVYAERLAGYAERFRAAGVSVSFQVSNTHGHGEMACAYDNMGLVYPGSPAERLVNSCGEMSTYCFCYRGEFFTEYITQAVASYAEAIRPERIWFDDDFEPRNRLPDRFGCFCDGCVAEYNRKHGTAFDREELVREILYGDGTHRKGWLDFTIEGITVFTRRLCTAVRKVSPKTCFALQNGPYGAYYAPETAAILDVMREVSGDDPWVRPGGGAYTEHAPHLMIKKTLDIAWKRATLPAYALHTAPEIENIPFTAFNKSAAGTALESAMQFAAGATDMSYSMLMYFVESPEWYAKSCALFAAQRPYWEHLSELNLRTRSAGIRYFTSADAGMMPLREGENIGALAQNHYAEVLPFLREGFPITFDRREESVILLLPEDVRGLTEADIDRLLAKNVIVDGETVQKLAERGVDLGMDVRILNDLDGIFFKERFADHPTSPKQGTFAASWFASGRKNVASIKLRTDRAEIISTLAANAGEDALKYRPDLPLGDVTECIVTTEKGGRWAVLGYAPWRQTMPTFVRDHILDVAEYIGGKLAARIKTEMLAALWPRVNAEGRTSAVSLLNCTVGNSGEVEILLRRPAGKRFVFKSQYNGSRELTPEWQGEDEVKLCLPGLDAWSVGTVFAE
ncbi:MAG: hypothetical protein IJC53_05695 [Clostridia bacterium]|nr:hypothetical protein [Clostridia bacterium]